MMIKDKNMPDGVDHIHKSVLRAILKYIYIKTRAYQEGAIQLLFAALDKHSGEIIRGMSLLQENIGSVYDKKKIKKYFGENKK